MIAYKYVDEEHAKAFKNGSLRIGTFSSYSALEGPRRDQNEATDIRIVDSVITDELDYRDAALFEKSVSPFINGKMIGCTFNNFTFIKQYPPQFVFCMSTHATPEIKFEKKQSLFEIKGARSLASIIQKKYFDVLGISKVGRVQYFERNNDWREERDFSSPFIKDYAFRFEKEYRICWQPKNIYVEPFITEEDDQIAQLIKQIF